MARHTVAAIVAMDEGRVIGGGNKLLWHIPEDLKNFSDLTKGHAVLMGRNTWDSLPKKYQPLPNRLNIVCSRKHGGLDLPEGVIAYGSPEQCIRDFLSDTLTTPTKTLWVIGGEQIYKATQPYWTELYLTLVHSKHMGDAFFPEFEQNFALVESNDRTGFSFRKYIRKHS